MYPPRSHLQTYCPGISDVVLADAGRLRPQSRRPDNGTTALLKSVGGGQHSFINKDNKTVARAIVAKSNIDVENQCHGIIKTSKYIEILNASVSVEGFESKQKRSLCLWQRKKIKK